MHEVVTGYFSPNSYDTAAGITAGFGATINIINGAKECNKATEDDKAKTRKEYYEEFLEHFKIDTKAIETDASMACKDQKPFPDKSAGKVYSYFDKGKENKCKVVKY